MSDPASPEGETDFMVVAKDILSQLYLRIQSCMGKGPIKKYPPSDSAVALVEGKLIEAYRLGLAARRQKPAPESADAIRMGKTGHIPVEKVLMSQEALALEEVLILGIKDDSSTYYASSRGDDPWLIAMCEVFKHKLLSGQFE